MATLGEMIVRVGADTKKFVIDMQDVQKTVGDAAQAVEASSQRWRELGSQLTSAGAALSGILSLPIAGAGAAALNLAGSYEQANIAFTTMLGSAEKATQMLNQLRDFAARTPFQFDDLVTATQRMMAYGIAAEQVIPTLEAVGNAIAAIGGGSAEIERAITALGQMTAKGTVSAEEMKQLAELGLPAWQYLADAIGVSIPEAMDLVRKKAVEAKDAVPAILAAMQNDFAGMMDRQSQTLLGRWSTFKDEVANALRELGAALLPTAKSLLEAITPLTHYVGELAQKFATLPEPIRMLALGLGALLAALGPVLLVAGQIISMWPALTAAFSAAGPVIAAVASPVTLVVAALTLLGVWVATHWDQVRAVLYQAWEGLAELWTAVWKEVRDKVLNIWNSIVDVAESVWGAIGPYVSAVWDGVAEAWQAVWGTISPWIGKVWNGIKSFITNIAGGIRNAAVAVWDEIVQAIRRFIEWAKKIPGVEKWLTLDKAWESAKKYTNETKAATQAMSAQADAAALVVPKLNLVRGATEKLENAQNKTNAALDAAKEHTRQLTARWREQTQALAAWQEANHIPEELPLITSATDKMVQSFDHALAGVRNFSQYGIEELQRMSGVINQLSGNIEDVARKLPDLNENMRKLGLATETEIQQRLDDIRQAWENIRESSIATAEEKQRAEEKYLQAVINAYREMGKQVDPEIKARFDALRGHIDATEKTDLPRLGNAFQHAMQQVSTAISNAAQSIVGILLGTEKGSITDALQKLGQGILSSLVEPWLNAFSNIIENGIKKLIGWLLGETGLQGALSSIGGKIKDVFGGIVGGGAGGAVSGVSGVGGAIGGAGGVASSLLTGGIAGGLSIVGSVVGASMTGGDLGKIEVNTRYTQIGIIGHLGVIELLWKHLDQWWASREIWEDIKEKLSWMWGRVDQALPALEDDMHAIVGRLTDLPSRISDALGPQISITVEGNVIGNQDFIDYLARELARRATMQGA